MEKPSVCFAILRMEVRRRGFSILELLVACAVLSAILVVMFSIVNHASELWKSSNARIEAFQGARLGYENLTKMISEATLNTYWDYNDPNAPDRYIRKSELHFLVGRADALLGGGSYSGQAVFFQSPAVYNATSGASRTGKLTDLLNACGFFVEYASDKSRGWVPPHVNTPGKERYRLMQWLQPSRDLSVYETSAGASANSWISAGADAVPIADNVIALIIWPKEPQMQTKKVLADSYGYDSRANADNRPQPVNANQLPPILQVAMVAIDEPSANRLGSNLKSTIDAALAGLFQNAPGVGFETDMKQLEKALSEKGINYRVFVSAVPLHEAKWSPEG